MIAFDSNIFMYVLDSNGAFGREAQRLLEQGQGDGCASELVYAELLSAPLFVDPMPRKAATDFLDQQRLVYIRPDREVMLQAAAIRAAAKIKVSLADALHLACALQAGAEVFITNDHDIAKLRIDGLIIQKL